jgi:hypothetical protein
MAVESTLGQRLLHVAWMSIGLGVAMELILVLLAAGFGKSPAVEAVAADTVQKVSWSSLVCIGLAVGTTASKLRLPLMGLAGLLAAPFAFNTARASGSPS